jgi:6-phosphogluconate dehydrogenase
MVHNGLEYGDMQLIAEGYFLLKNLINLSNPQMHEVFNEWNKGVMDSFLVEITRDILIKEDDLEGHDGFLLDKILDSAGQKGTGKWTAINALDVGVPVTLIGEAVFARCLSSQKDERVRASSVLTGPQGIVVPEGEKEKWISDIHDALYAAKIVSYAQGFVLLKAAASEFNWKLNYGAIASIWRGGCIIRSKFLGNIKEAFDKNPALENLMIDPFFTVYV